MGFGGCLGDPQAVWLAIEPQPCESEASLWIVCFEGFFESAPQVSMIFIGFGHFRSVHIKFVLHMTRFDP